MNTNNIHKYSLLQIQIWILFVKIVWLQIQIWILFVRNIYKYIRICEYSLHSGLLLLPDGFQIFVIAKLRNIEFVPAKELFYLYLAKKGQSSNSRATPCCTRPPGHSTPKKSVAGVSWSSFQVHLQFRKLPILSQFNRCIHFPMSVNNKIIKHS